jgi:stress response protein YsnF
MAEVDIQTALDWRGRTVLDACDQKIGTLREIYLDQDERPTWGSIHTGLFGLRESLVPLTAARDDGNNLRVPFDADHVKQAPNVDPDVQLAPDDEDELYRHYGIDEPEGQATRERSPEEPADSPQAGDRTARHKTADGGAIGASVSGDQARPAQRDDQSEQPEDATRASAPTEAGADDQTDDAMTRSEEEVHIGKRVRERGRVRLKKYVVTDYVDTKIPVKREEVRLEREPPQADDERR